MKRTEIIFFFAAALGTAAMGCSKETTSSENIKTGGIAALIDVTASNSTESLMHVNLVVGGSDSNTYVELANGDKLIGMAAGVEKTLGSVDPGEYEAKFSTVAEGTEFMLHFERPDDTSALENRGTLPAPFSISAPKSTDTVARAADLTVTWDASSAGDDMVMQIDGTCIFSKTIDVSDSGTYTIAAGTLDATDEKKAETCEVDITMTRSRSGTADSAFDGESWFRLHQARGASFSSTP